jgi:hypothetical protein
MAAAACHGIGARIPGRPRFIIVIIYRQISNKRFSLFPVNPRCLHRADKSSHPEKLKNPSRGNRAMKNHEGKKVPNVTFKTRTI